MNRLAKSLLIATAFAAGAAGCASYDYGYTYSEPYGYTYSEPYAYSYDNGYTPYYYDAPYYYYAPGYVAPSLSFGFSGGWRDHDGRWHRGDEHGRGNEHWRDNDHARNEGRWSGRAPATTEHSGHINNGIPGHQAPPAFVGDK